ncbi:MAG: hypothetical protein KatS3mg081_2819 [Gemmatimonadales bacterium]|nr:hypothetical protein HRbin33_01820 [bacterium HR33]GIW53464.1 MAG: hypothetical protein KatS3mg081_2819 [Gemmatimonadales bacterium]
MRYFHRTSIPPDEVLAEAERFFSRSMSLAASDRRRRDFSGNVGRITVRVGAEGGHYTLVTVETDQVGESEADKMAKRFLAVVHQRAHPEHQLRGAY